MTAGLVAVPRQALEHILDILEISEDVLLDDGDMAAYETLCRAVKASREALEAALRCELCGHRFTDTEGDELPSLMEIADHIRGCAARGET